MYRCVFILVDDDEQICTHTHCITVQDKLSNRIFVTSSSDVSMSFFVRYIFHSRRRIQTKNKTCIINTIFVDSIVDTAPSLVPIRQAPEQHVHVLLGSYYHFLHNHYGTLFGINVCIQKPTSLIIFYPI